MSQDPKCGKCGYTLTPEGESAYCWNENCEEYYKGRRSMNRAERRAAEKVRARAEKRAKRADAGDKNEKGGAT